MPEFITRGACAMAHWYNGQSEPACPALFGGVFSLDQIADVGSAPEQNLKLISSEIIFEVFQPV